MPNVVPEFRICTFNVFDLVNGKHHINGFVCGHSEQVEEPVCSDLGFDLHCK